MSDRFVFFYHSRSPFSQWHRVPFSAKSIVDPKREEVVFSSAEQYMMAEKALLFGDEAVYLSILSARTPGEQKALGRIVRNYDEETWKKWREHIVYAGNMAKFSSNEGLRKILLDTGDKCLAEASPSDRIWGVGLSDIDPRIRDQTKWRGLNLLGIALMKVRETLREN